MPQVAAPERLRLRSKQWSCAALANANAKALAAKKEETMDDTDYDARIEAITAESLPNLAPKHQTHPSLHEGCGEGACEAEAPALIKFHWFGPTHALRVG